MPKSKEPAKKGLHKNRQKKTQDAMFYSIILGVLILSIGIGFIGLKMGKLGSYFISIGSVLLMISVAIFAFVLD